MAWLSNTTGPTLSSFDSWLFIRSLKTLKIRFEAQERNAQKIAKVLTTFPQVEKVLYPGIGGMISFIFKTRSKFQLFVKAALDHLCRKSGRSRNIDYLSNDSDTRGYSDRASRILWLDGQSIAPFCRNRRSTRFAGGFGAGTSVARISPLDRKCHCCRFSIGFTLKKNMI